MRYRTLVASCALTVCVPLLATGCSSGSSSAANTTTTTSEASGAAVSSAAAPHVTTALPAETPTAAAPTTTTAAAAARQQPPKPLCQLLTRATAATALGGPVTVEGSGNDACSYGLKGMPLGTLKDLELHWQAEPVAYAVSSTVQQTDSAQQNSVAATFGSGATLVYGTTDGAPAATVLWNSDGISYWLVLSDITNDTSVSGSDFVDAVQRAAMSVKGRL